MRTRGIAALVVALTLGPVPLRSVWACSEVAGVEVESCSRRPPQTRTASRDPAASLMSLLNRERSSVGLPTLRWDARAAAVAREHSRAMARTGRLHHNPKLRSSRWRRANGLPRTFGENVGVGPDLKAIHGAFMDSAGHRGQILARAYRTVGIGVVSTRYEVWVTQVFVGRRSGGRASSFGRPAAGGSTQPGARRASGVILPKTPPADTAVLAASAAGDDDPGFPWLATAPSAGLLVLLAGRRLRRRRAWER